MRDWNRALRRASFRGARFWVEEDGPEGGRRVAVHGIVGGEVLPTEDLGRRAREYRVRAYVASDLADAEGLALEAACQAAGPGRLVLPLDAGLSAHCVGCRRDRNRDRAGYLGYDLTFIEAGGAAAALATGLPALRTSFADGLAGAAAALAAGL